jgi:hypothetical protein
MLSLGYGTSITVGECLGDPQTNWYRNASGAPANAALSQSLVSKSIEPSIAFVGCLLTCVFQ